MVFEKVLEHCRGPRPRVHRPKFRTEPGPRGGWRIFDGEKAIADALPEAFDVWSFSPFEPDVFVADSVGEPSATLDVHTVRNTWLNFGSHGWLPSWCQIGTRGLRWEWPEPSDAELEALIELEASLTKPRPRTLSETPSGPV